ncbi:hypothetical protein PSAC2689_40292 [Paraburkholderia sacchari]
MGRCSYARASADERGGREGCGDLGFGWGAGFFWFQVMLSFSRDLEVEVAQFWCLAQAEMAVLESLG